MVVDNATKANSSSSSPANELQCQLVNEKVVNCSSTVYSNKDAWRSSRSYINDQIRRLRAQLSELKVILVLCCWWWWWCGIICISVTRFGNLLYVGQLLKPLATINLPKSPTFLRNFCKGFKIFYFREKSFLGNLYRLLATFTGHTG